MARTTKIVPFREKLGTMRAYLERGSDQLRMILPKTMTPEAMIRYALTAASTNPALFDCTPQSVGLALMNSAALGLEPNGRDGHLVPYGNSCVFIPDYKGLIRLAHQNERLVSFEAHAVRELDDFEFEYGSAKHIRHRFDHTVEDDEQDRGPLVAAWAHYRLDNGAENFIVLTRGQVLKRRAVSKGSQSKSSPWQQWPEEMWAKTAAKVLSKFAPLGPSFDRAVAYDNALEGGDAQQAQRFAATQEPDEIFGKEAGGQEQEAQTQTEAAKAALTEKEASE
jgi:recombination protein RecT